MSRRFSARTTSSGRRPTVIAFWPNGSSATTASPRRNNHLQLGRLRQPGVVANMNAPESTLRTEEPYLLIQGVTKRFGAFTALQDIDLDIRKGEFVSFLGPSGCGKTTLLRAISGLDVQTTGSIHQAGRNISDLPVSARDFGIVFQSYALFPNLTIKDNVAYGLVSAGTPRIEIDKRVKELLELVG